jgi:DNA-binding response OmpR family regulator
MTARALKTFLGLRNYQVEIAATLHSAVALAPKIEFDVLVCDLTLPDGSGWELPAKLGERARSRAIAYSALDEPHHLLQSRQAGFAEHLVKGCDPDELVAAIERVFQGKGRFPK